jgi:hypothetical protein
MSRSHPANSTNRQPHTKPPLNRFPIIVRKPANRSDGTLVQRDDIKAKT